MSHVPVHGTWEPAPAARWEDAFLSGNGHHGALVFGDPNDGRVIVTQHTLVRPNGSEHARPPRLAAELPALQDRLLAGDRTAAESFTDGRPLQWVQPFHPAFQIRLSRSADTARGGYRRAVDFTTGEATAAGAAGRRPRRRAGGCRGHPGGCTTRSPGRPGRGSTRRRPASRT
ncbi:glycoside hydrolase N-terminal domain-containing protein, partial [Streptomyces diastatochromogenes]|uniref:glycoside hydrolase N-terminal domain-containing protein n=1 Tax=Streptomyces diastatochromogenes TaxID=42236 RepID=UPI0036BBC968